MALGVRKLDDEWLREQREISERMNKEHIAKFDRSFYGHMAKFADDERERDDDGTEKRVDHAASTIADLLVESGRFPHRTAALDHLLNSPHGNALLARLHKAAEQTEKESPMSSLQDIAKSHGVAGVVQIAKNIVDEQKSFRLTEEEFCNLIDTASRVTHPELGARAFEKVYERNPVLAKAIAVIKEMMPFQVDLQPLAVGGFDAQNEAIDNTEQSEAYQQLLRIGRDRWPSESEARQFSNAVSDPVNAKLAAKAIRRPRATTSYQFPFPR
jgi:hypothetical protein